MRSNLSAIFIDIIIAWEKKSLSLNEIAWPGLFPQICWRCTKDCQQDAVMVLLGYSLASRQIALGLKLHGQGLRTRNTLRIHMKRDEIRTGENPAKVLSLSPPVWLQTYVLNSRPSMPGQISTLPVSNPQRRATGNTLSLLQPEKHWRGSLMLV